MKVLLQRVTEAQVEVESAIVGSIQKGLLLFVGFGAEDNETMIRPLRDKIINLRIFPDEQGRFDRSVTDIEGEVLIVSQFTLYGDCKKGRRPDFTKALHPEKAETMYESFVKAFSETDLLIATGIFGAMMNVSLHNDGPVTLLLES